MATLEDYPLQFEDVDEETNARLRQLQPYGMMDGAITVGPDRYFYPRVPRERFLAVHNHPLHTSDIWVVTMPKCGTTWTQEMVWLIANDCNFSGAQTNLMPDRWNFLEMSYGLLFPDSAARSMIWQCMKTRPWIIPGILWSSYRLFYPRIYNPPRFVKTHVPLSMCPPRLLDTCKTVYVARNPKDALVSYFHHHNLMKIQGFEGTFKQFFDLFLVDKLLQLPFLPHVKEAWAKKDHPNLLFLFFEDMKADLRAVIRRVAGFLHKELTDLQVEKLYEHLKFDNFKNNPYVNFDTIKELGLMSEAENFIRKGKTGDWKNYLTPEMDDRMNRWMEENLSDTDLRFTTELKQQD